MYFHCFEIQSKIQDLRLYYSTANLLYIFEEWNYYYNLQVGDKLSLSITGMINGSSVTARNEVYIVITEAIHSVPIVPSLPILNPRPTDTPISNNNIQSQETTTTKDPNINNVSEVLKCFYF